MRSVRRSIRARECHCPLANASYTNMLHDVPTLVRVGAKLLRPSGAGDRDPGRERVGRTAPGAR
jgi:hypothetical protein